MRPSGLHAELEERGLKVWRDVRLLDAARRRFHDKHQCGAGPIGESRSALVAQFTRLDLGQSRSRKGAHWRSKIVPLTLEPIGALLEKLITSPRLTFVPTIRGASICKLVLRCRCVRNLQAGARKDLLSLVTANVDIIEAAVTYAKKLYGREREMAALHKAWDEGRTKIFAFDAMGGAGKTALVYHFVQALKASGWRGAQSVFAWSFYSQGSNEDRQTSADDFFKAAFKHFGGKEPPRDPREKGVELAHLVQAQRALLILDGLEPLQYVARGGGRMDDAKVGGVKDPGIKALLSLLADTIPASALSRPGSGSRNWRAIPALRSSRWTGCR